MSAVKYRATRRLPVIGHTRLTMGQIVEAGVAGPHLDRVQVACIFPGIKAFNFRLNGPEARALAALLAKAAAIAAIGGEQRREDEKFPRKP